jgi:uncharacterized protein (DUF362 family)
MFAHRTFLPFSDPIAMQSPSNANHQPSGRAPDGVSRRDFLIRTGTTAAVIGGGTAGMLALWQRRHVVPGFERETGRVLPSFSAVSRPGDPVLGIGRGTDRAAVVRAAIGALGGIGRFVGRGDVVLLKPNVAFDRPAALGATTHPETFRAVAQWVREAGAARILVADNPINSPAGCFLKSGLRAVANELSLDLVYPEPTQFAAIELGGEVLRHWPFFFGPFKQVTKVIGIAPCKDHNLCSGSMTMKNWYGLLGGRRNQFHQHIHSIVADFALMMKPTLVVLDGMNVLMRNGPTGGRLSDVRQAGTVVAGTDMVAVDAFGYEHLLERNPDELLYLQKAHERGWGNRMWREVARREAQG